MTTIVRHTIAATLITSLGLLASTAAQAQSFDAARIYGAAPDRDGGMLALAAISGHEYQGSKKTRALLLPGVDYQWSNGFFAGTTNGLGFNFSKHPQMSYGLRVTADFGRDEDRSPALKGMGDIDIRPEIGGFFNYNLSQSFVLTSSLRYGSGNDRKGMLVDFGAVYLMVLAPQWRLGLGGAMTVANAEYQQSAFGVSLAQSASSGYKTYTPSAGVRDVRANASLTYSIDQRTGITAALSASSLQGDAKNSPLSQEKTSLNGVLAVTYLF
ncbi:MipA/OmpV family protein [Paucibacter sp. AS339]|uniref:MipA/OmpV family protein n=1 Tax=Paucibacter hankyongi TaxID=3133434 RepID=UPI0030B1B8A2